MYGKVTKSHDYAIIVGSGESLKNFDFSILDGLVTIAVNGAISAFRPMYWFTLDPDDKNYKIMQNNIEGVGYFCAIPERYGAEKGRYYRQKMLPHVTYLRRIKGSGHLGQKPGMSKDPSSINTGNSAYGALNLALHMGAKRIAILGVDATSRYFYSDGTPGRLDHLPRLFSTAVPCLGSARVVNGSPSSRVTCFEKMTPEEAVIWAVGNDRN